MKIAKIVLAGTAALAIISSPTLAQQALTGTLTKVDKAERSEFKQVREALLAEGKGGGTKTALEKVTKK